MPQACNFIKKETLEQVFSCEFCEIPRNIFFTEHLWTFASAYTRVYFSFERQTVKKLNQTQRNSSPKRF